MSVYCRFFRGLWYTLQKACVLSGGLLVSAYVLAQPQNAPITVEAERIQGVPDLGVQGLGRVTVEQDGARLQGRLIDYDQVTNRVQAQGDVQLQSGQTLLQGEQANIELGHFTGQIKKPSYDLGAPKGYGEAHLATLHGKDHIELADASYTMCRKIPGPSWMQDWFLRADRIEFDKAENQAYAYSTSLRFQGVPIFWSPLVTFPISSKRRSGWLAPTLGYDPRDGLSLSQPYYWNIAPNRDMTITPTLFSNRGVNFVTLTRYLESDYSGQLFANALPKDRLRNQDTRWGFDFKHLGQIPVGLTGLNPVLFAVNIKQVSDSNYWRDFGDGVLSERLLDNQASFSWHQGALSMKANWQWWQVQQDTQAPIVAPFRKWPQFVTEYNTQLDAGFDVNVLGGFTRFRASEDSNANPNTDRSTLVTQLSYPWQGAAGFLTPKLTLQARHYDFARAVMDNQGQSQRRKSLLVPTWSVDSGLVFERYSRLFDRSIRQTLEPRVKVAYTPFEDQSAIPNYDSGAQSFDSAQIFSDNAFTGYDRIADSKFVTLGVSSRILGTQTGQQWAQLSLAQRYLLQEQRVTLPGGSPVSKGPSNILAELNTNWSAHWSTRTNLEYNQDTHRVEKSTLDLRYAPSAYRVLNLSYLFQRQSSERYGLGGQWPLNDLWETKAQPDTGKWYAVGRLNYDRADERFTDGVFGLEYDGGCWIFRAALQRDVVGQPEPINRVLLQLELVDLLSVGQHPLAGLEDYVSGYQSLR